MNQKGDLEFSRQTKTASPDVRLRCQRIGCDEMFTEDDNLEGSCRYHSSGSPTFVGSTASKLTIRRGGATSCTNPNKDYIGGLELEDKYVDNDITTENHSIDEEQDDTGHHSFVPDGNDDLPYEGKRFKSQEEAYKFYNKYARGMGFSIRRGWIRRSKATKEIIARNFCCSKEGEKNDKDKNDFGRTIKRRKSGREGCLAQMYVVRKSVGLWIIQKFTEEHTHVLATPSEVAKLRSHNRLSNVAKDLADTLSICGIKPSKLAQVLQEGFHDFGIGCKNDAHNRTNQESNIGQERMSVQLPLTANQGLTPMVQQDLLSTALKVVQLGNTSLVKYEMVKNALEDVLGRLNSMSIESHNSSEDISYVSQVPCDFVVRDPITLEGSNGRPTDSQRLKSSMEASTSQSKRVKKTCKGCGQEGHYINTCSRKNEGSSVVQEEKVKLEPH